MFETSKPVKASRALAISASLLALLILARLALLFASPDVISHTDELYQGYIGIELLYGLKAWIQEYQPDAYTAGSIITGLLAAPLFKVFGSSLFVLKLVPLLFQTATLLLLLNLFLTHFGIYPAIAAGLFMIFPAPGYAALSTMALGSHPRALFFLVLIYCLFLKILKKPNLKNWICFGLSGGIACWHSQINIPFFICCALPAFFMATRKKTPFGFVLGTLIGFFPWIFYNATHSWEGANYLAHLVQIKHSFQMIPWLGEYLRLVFIHFPQSLFFPSTIVSFMVTWLMYSFYISACILAFKNRYQTQSRALFPFIIFPFIFLCFFAQIRSQVPFDLTFTPFRFRYFVPFYYSLLLPIVIVFWNHRLRLAIWLLIGLNISGYFFLLRSPSTEKTYNLPGYYLENPSRVLGKSCENSRFYFFYCDSFWQKTQSNEALVDLMSALPIKNKHLFLNEWGRRHGEILSVTDNRTIIPPSVLSTKYKKFFVIGVAKGIPWESLPSLESAITFIRNQPLEYQPYYLMVLGGKALTWTTFSSPPQKIFPEFFERLESANSEEKKFILRGAGKNLLWTASSPAHLKFILDSYFSSFGEEGYDELLWGIGWKLKTRAGDLDMIKQTRGHYKDKIIQGYNEKEKDMSDADFRIDRPF